MVAPSVPNDQARLRFFVACEHTDEQLVTTVDTVASAIAEMRRASEPALDGAPAVTA
jgi:hypothetical protein